MKEEHWRLNRAASELESDDALTHQEYSTELMGAWTLFSNDGVTAIATYSWPLSMEI
eukprot:IDg2789t1